MPAILLLFFVFPVVYTQPSSQVWLKENTYAEYTFNVEAVGFLNKTVFSFDNKVVGTFRWKCTERNEDAARLNFSLTFTGESGFTISKEAYLDVSNNELSMNGNTIGTTFLWGPRNLTVADTVTLWNYGPDKVTGNVIANGLATTPQGKQNITVVQVNGTVSGRPVSLIGSFDSDTGVFVDGRIDGDPTLFLLNVDFIGIEGRVYFSDTNIDLGPDYKPEQGISVLIVIPIIVFATLFTAIYWHGRRIKISYKKSIKRRK